MSELPAHFRHSQLLYICWRNCLFVQKKTVIFAFFLSISDTVSYHFVHLEFLTPDFACLSPKHRKADVSVFSSQTKDIKKKKSKSVVAGGWKVEQPTMLTMEGPRTCGRALLWSAVWIRKCQPRVFGRRWFSGGYETKFHVCLFFLPSVCLTSTISSVVSLSLFFGVVVGGSLYWAAYISWAQKLKTCFSIL